MVSIAYQTGFNYNTTMSESPGSVLRDKRIELGLSYGKVAEQTLIRIPIIEALEEDDHSVFASESQFRGFIRNYAQFLGLDMEEIAPDYSIKANIEVIQEDNKIDDRLPGTPQLKKEPEKLPPDEPGEIIQVDLPKLDESEGDKTRSQKIFQEIGSSLYERRSLLSFSLADVESLIHIKDEYLNALETGNLEILPSSVQTRGILQNYARFLDLDVDKIMLLFAEGLQQRREESIPVDAKRRGKLKDPSPALVFFKKYFTLDLLFGSILIIGMLVFLIWSTTRMLDSSNENPSQATLPNVSDVLEMTNQSYIEAQKTASTAENPGEITEIRPTNTLILPLEIYNTPIQVLVIPNQSVWIRVVADGDIEFEGRLEAGDAKTYAAETNLSLVCGNAAAIQVFFKGESLGALGPLGSVVLLSFDSNGLIEPEATPTPTLLPADQANPSSTETQLPNP